MKTIQHIGILIIILGFISCNSKTTENDQATSVVQEKTYPVKFQKIKTQSIAQTLDYTANLTAFKVIHYAPASPGRIDQINVEVGSRVHKGQILVESDRTQLQQANTQLKNAEITYQRIDKLFKLGSASKQQYDQAKTAYDLAKSSTEFLIENTTLTSPINGIVTGKYFENGEFYSGVPNTDAGKAAVISIMQINPLKALVSVSQNHYPALTKGLMATITSDIYPAENFEGKISKIYPIINESTRTFQVEVLVANKDERLRPGMFSRIKIKLKDKDALVVPAISVLKEEGTNNRFVFVNDHGRAKQIPVKIGKRYNDKVELISDQITEGVEIIVEGQGNLFHGSKIKLVTE